MLEDTPRILQNEMEKSSCATLVMSCFYIILNDVKGVVTGGWNSQKNDSCSDSLKALESSLSYPVA